jgi:hypothetical protein
MEPEIYTNIIQNCISFTVGFKNTTRLLHVCDTASELEHEDFPKVTTVRNFLSSVEHRTSVVVQNDRKAKCNNCESETELFFIDEGDD